MKTSVSKIKIAAIVTVIIIAAKMSGMMHPHSSYTPSYKSTSSYAEPATPAEESTNTASVEQSGENYSSDQEPTMEQKRAAAALLILAAIAEQNQQNQETQYVDEPTYSDDNSYSNSGSSSQLDIHDVVSTELGNNIVY